MRLHKLGTILGLSLSIAGIGAVVACSSGSGDDGQSAGADLSSADGGTLTPVQQMAQKLQGAWVTPGDATGPVALIMSTRDPSTGGLSVDRDTPHKHVDGNVDDKGITRDRSDLDLTIMSLDGNGGGTLKLSEFIFDQSVKANHRNEIYTFTLNGDSLKLIEVDLNFSNDQFGQDAGVPFHQTDAGAIQLRPPATFTRQPAFCGSGQNFDCSEQFSNGTFKQAMPEACKGREDLCLFCQPDHTCATKVPSSCELARFTCVDTIEHCEFGENSDPNNGSSPGEVTTIDPDGNAIDCKNSPTKGKNICCEVFNRGKAD
jgi:hypothetical protein